MAFAFAVFVCISMCVVKAAHVGFPCLAVAGGWLDTVSSQDVLMNSRKSQMSSVFYFNVD